MAAFAVQSKPQKAPTPSFAVHVLPYMKNYCLSCHTGEYAADGIDLSKIKTAKDAINSLNMMKKSAKYSSNKAMPPKTEKKQPTDNERKMFAAWISAQKKP